jgi:hypothetical protein
LKSIQYLQRAQIDIVKWDQCIETAPNGLIYGYSFYLDHMAENWDALVLEDYEAVMPLPWKKKWGIRYVYTPMFLQRLGVFGSNIDSSIEQDFYKRAANHFSFIDLMTNASVYGQSWKTRQRNNFIIPINRSYVEIRQHYSAECTKNIRKAVNRNCSFTRDITIGQVIDLFRDAYGHYSPQINDEIYQRLSGLAETAIAHEKLMVCGVKDAKDQTILFGALIFIFGNRLYYIAGAPTKAGRNARATYYFIDQLLKQFAGNPLVFDFEGSDIPEVAAFYNRFGPQQETYYHSMYNGLPWWIRWAKRKSLKSTTS